MAGNSVDGDASARELFDVAALACRWLRTAARRRQPAWSLPQLDALAFLRGKPGANLSELAAQLGVGLPTASTLVSRLVGLGLVDRRDDPTERRRTLLRLTPKGERQLESAGAAVRDELAERLRSLPARDQASLSRTLGVLRELFTDTVA